MKGKTNFKALIASLLLIVAGTLSPSNGVDERSYKTPLELITTMFLIVAIGFVANFIWALLENHKEVSEGLYQQKKP